MTNSIYKNAMIILSTSSLIFSPLLKGSEVLDREKTSLNSSTTKIYNKNTNIQESVMDNYISSPTNSTIDDIANEFKKVEDLSSDAIVKEFTEIENPSVDDIATEFVFL